MSRSSRSKVRKQLDALRESGFISVEVEKQWCDRCEKYLYNSKHDARAALMSQMKSKTIRAYPCPVTRGRYHVTKDQKNKWSSAG